MRNFSIDIVWAKVQMAFTVIGGWIGYFVGGVDGLMTALLIFMVLDYVTGLMCAIADKKLSSSVGFKGICKKVLIIMLVGVAHVVDLHVIGTGDAMRSAVARGRSVLISSHLLDDLADLTNSFYFIEAGTLVEKIKSSSQTLKQEYLDTYEGGE